MRNILERVTIPEKGNDEIEAKLRAKLDSLPKEKQQLNFDPILRWYRNDIKNNVSSEELKSRYLDNFRNIIDEIVEYYDSLKKNPVIANEKILLNNREILIKNLSEIRRYENAIKFFSKVRMLANRKISLKTPKEYELQTDDMLAIELIGESEHIMAWETRGYETTNKFVFNLWQNPNMNVDYGNKEINSPYCTRMKMHWANYSEGIFEDEYRQVWFLKKLDGDFKYVHGTLNNPNVKKIFDEMKGFGPALILAMDDSGLDLLDDNDEEYDPDNNGEFRDELLKLDIEIFSDAIYTCKNENAEEEEADYHYEYNSNDDIYIGSKVNHYDDEDDEDDEEDDEEFITFSNVIKRRKPIIQNFNFDLDINKENDVYIQSLLPNNIIINLNSISVEKDGSYDLIKYIINLAKNKYNSENNDATVKTRFIINKDSPIHINNIIVPNNITKLHFTNNKNYLIYTKQIDFTNCKQINEIGIECFHGKFVFKNLTQVLNCKISNIMRGYFRVILQISELDKVIIENTEQTNNLKQWYSYSKFDNATAINELIIQDNIDIPVELMSFFYYCEIKTLTIYGKNIKNFQNLIRLFDKIKILNIEYISVLNAIKKQTSNMDYTDKREFYSVANNITLNIYYVDDDNLLQLKFINSCKDINIYNNKNNIDITNMIIKPSYIDDNKNYHVADLSESNKLKKIKIQEPISHIDTYAFSSCKNLEYVEFPNTLIEIGPSAFKYDSKLKNIIFKPSTNTLTLELGCFEYCSAIETVDLTPYSSINLCHWAFTNCSALKTVDLPNIANSILETVFSDCSSLENIDLTKTNITTIDQNCFENCENLKIIKLPNTLISIKRHCFENCKSLEEIDLSNTTLQSIGQEAFRHCENLKIIKFPNTLISIDSGCFGNCKSLKEIDLSNTQIKKFNFGAIYNCNNLKTIKFPKTLEDMSNSSIENCDLLEEIDLSNTQLKKIICGSIDRCNNLKIIKLPKTLTEFSLDSFKFLDSLETVYIPNELKNLDLKQPWRGNNPIHIEYV